MRKTTAALLSLALTAITLAACTSIDCPMEHTVMSSYLLRKADQTQDTLRDTLSITTRRFNGTDTLLLNKGIGLTKLKLSISYSNPEDTLVFKFRNQSYQATDTVWVKKVSTPHFESVDCSASFFHEVQSVRTTHHAIDSIIINNPSVDYDPQRIHFHLYLKSRD